VVAIIIIMVHSHRYSNLPGGRGSNSSSLMSRGTTCLTVFSFIACISLVVVRRAVQDDQVTASSSGMMANLDRALATSLVVADQHKSNLKKEVSPSKKKTISSSNTV